MSRNDSATIFDQETFLSNFAGMEDLACEAVKSFLDSLPRLTADLEAAILALDGKKMELSAHTLKSATSTFYAEPSRLLAWQLEQLGHGDTFEGAGKVMGDLKAELDKLKRVLSEFLMRQKFVK